MPRKERLCTDCGIKLSRSGKGIRCRECSFKSVRKEFVVCPICGLSKHRGEYRLDIRKRRVDTRQFSKGCQECRDSRNPRLKTTNVCTVCKQDKPKEGFVKGACVDCLETRRQKEEDKRKAAQKLKEEKEQRQRQKEIASQERVELFNQGLKRCAMCGDIKPLDAFSNQKNNKVDGKQAYCLNCMVIRRARWATDNQDRNKELRKLSAEKIKGTIAYKVRKKYQKAVRERRMQATPKNIRLTGKQWETLCAEYNNICLCCGAKDKELTIDHIIPVSKGGLHTLENVQPLCMECNILKRDTEINYKVTLFEFL